LRSGHPGADVGGDRLPFRRIVKRQGAALVVSEMIASEAAIRDTGNR